MPAAGSDATAGAAWPGPSDPTPAAPASQEPAPLQPEPVQETPKASSVAQPSLEVRRTRTGTAYVASIVGIVVTALVIVFIVQNLHEAKVHFVTLTFSLPVGVIILGGAVAGALIVVLVSLARILQLRIAARRHRRAHRQPT
jgi:uncharacterized integral membrane protein